MPNFTRDWFSHNIPSWEKHLSIFKDKPVEALEIGTYEGRGSLWLLENILTNPKAHLTCVDPWANYNCSDKCGFTLNEIEERCHDNLKDYKDKVTFIKGSSFEEVPKLTKMFDIIYVDGAHTVDGCWTDACNSFIHLKEGGIIIFDDYDWELFRGTKEHPKQAIDDFIKEYRDSISVEELGYQAIIKRCKQ